MRIHHLNSIIQIIYSIISDISSNSDADNEGDEEMVVSLDWFVVFEYECVARCVHCD